MELLGPPPRSLVEAASRANLFFDNSQWGEVLAWLSRRVRPSSAYHIHVKCLQTGASCSKWLAFFSLLRSHVCTATLPTQQPRQDAPALL